jgi:hypothetical protein
MSVTDNASGFLPANLLLSLDSVLGAMLDHAIAVTNADRGVFLEADSAGSLVARLARRIGGSNFRQKALLPARGSCAKFSIANRA